MKRNLLWLFIFAVAMAYLEAAIVVYLRELYYPENIQAIFPVKIFNKLDFVIEIGREAATIVMMLSVALLVERKNFIRTFAAFLFLFGVWDIFYYIWLKITIGWPLAWGEWDILFLIPWIWMGPWICPVLISLLFVFWGTAVLRSAESYTFTRMSTILFVTGCGMALFSFLQPALPLLKQGSVEAFMNYLPGDFWWWLFVPGYFLMNAGLVIVLLKGGEPY
ncbi:MAG: hypothetical protein ACE5GL_02510 [Calditrichia bacterium]